MSLTTETPTDEYDEGGGGGAGGGGGDEETGGGDYVDEYTDETNSYDPTRE